MKFDLKEIKKDLIKGIADCTQRGLLHSAKWLAELNFTLSDVKLPPSEIPQINNDHDAETEIYTLSKSYFDAKEYDRCAFFTQNCVTPKARFLHLYATYLSGEKKKIDNMTEANCPPDPAKNGCLKQLLSTLQIDYADKKLDSYGLYLYGVLLKKLDLISLAIDIFLESVHANPMLWGAWLELSPLIPNREKLLAITLPDHWIKHFFLANSYLEQLCNDEALDICIMLQTNGFEKSHYLMAQIAIAHHNRRGCFPYLYFFLHVLIFFFACRTR